MYITTHVGKKHPLESTHRESQRRKFWESKPETNEISYLQRVSKIHVKKKKKKQGNENEL
jgi:hypothetical protein